MVRDEEDKKLQAAIKRKRDRLEQKRLEEKRGSEQEPKVAATSADTTTTTTASASAGPDGKAKGGSGVLGALSNAGAWFGTKKGSAESTTVNTEEPKK